MILDNPTSSLDNKVTQQIMDTILKHPKWSKKTYVISTRKAGILERFDRVIFMDEGRIRFFGKPTELKQSSVYQNYEKSQEDQHTQVETNLDMRRGQEDDQQLPHSSERDYNNRYRLNNSNQDLRANSRKLKKHSRNNSKHSFEGLRSSYRHQQNSQNRFEEFNISIHSLGTFINRNAETIRGFQRDPGKKKVLKNHKNLSKTGSKFHNSSL